MITYMFLNNGLFVHLMNYPHQRAPYGILNTLHNLHIPWVSPFSINGRRSCLKVVAISPIHHHALLIVGNISIQEQEKTQATRSVQFWRHFKLIWQRGQIRYISQVPHANITGDIMFAPAYSPLAGDYAGSANLDQLHNNRSTRGTA